MASCMSQVLRARWNAENARGSDASNYICSLIDTDSPSRPQIVTDVLRTIICPLVRAAYVRCSVCVVRCTTTRRILIMSGQSVITLATRCTI